MLRGFLSSLACCFLAGACLPHGGAAAQRGLVVEPWSLPAGDSRATQPWLARTPDGGLLLSWIDIVPGEVVPDDANTDRAGPGHVPANDKRMHRLQFSRHIDTRWSPSHEISRGDNWFVNWADIPHITQLRDGTLWAHWLQRNGRGVYDYGIALVHSTDNGASWSAPVRIEPEGAKLDYGFVSFWEQPDGTLGLAWLDARQKAPPPNDATHDHSAHHASPESGAMMLRAASVAADGTRPNEWPLDLSTCDCCPTAVATTRSGPVVVYRGRSAEEIRDIRLVHFDGTRWSAPRIVHDDGWRMPGCPVNGPSVTAIGEALAVAWYTEVDGVPTVRIARAASAGDDFSQPIQIAQGPDVLGRVVLASDRQTVWMAWLERAGDGQALWLARLQADSLVERERIRVATLAGKGAATGLPVMQVQGDNVFLAWTDVVDGAPQLRGARVH